LLRCTCASQSCRRCAESRSPATNWTVAVYPVTVSVPPGVKVQYRFASFVEARPLVAICGWSDAVDFAVRLALDAEVTVMPLSAIGV